ncbi:hypothetical protein BH09MYX1_BH09MYX1_49240 [soil metagenome]
MPTYEYLCKECGHEWEADQRISADPLKDCPSCGKPAASRQISGGSFILKGGGWYADLYSSSKPKTESKGESKGEAKADAKSESKAETKSESKAETKSETKAETKSETKAEAPKATPPAKPST